MATIKFYYRSKKDKANLSFKFLHSYKGNNFQFWLKTRLEVSKNYWENHHNKIEIDDAEIEDIQLKTKSELNRIKRHILKEFANKPDQTTVSKEWLEREVNHYYFNSNDNIPKTLTKYIDYYIRVRNNILKDSTKNKYKMLRNKIIRYEEKRHSTVLIKNVGERFKEDFVNYQKECKYAQNTIHKDIALIKTFCKHAKKYGLETHNQMEFLKADKEEIDVVYLNEAELNMIRKTRNLSSELQIAKDWLLISCNTGQRVSDFMEFDYSKTRWENGYGYLDFIQQKTNKRMALPLFDEVVDILKAYDNNFPTKMDNNKYNENLKELCKVAGINQKVHGKVLQKVGEVQGYRRVEGEFEKYRLISSHIGRRSFATNFYSVLETPHLISMTGHSTEKRFRDYLPKTINYGREIHIRLSELKQTA